MTTDQLIYWQVSGVGFGEGTKEVLNNLGYSDDIRVEFEAKGVI